ncbi:MAG: NAD(P)H-binding protein [Dehalococcoidia bacterium]|nr:NAD(P)H-binding protein [Dehalococcoidia bacterium]
MASVLLTGGTGGLGSELPRRLVKAGHAVRIMSRRAAPGGAEWARADLLSGEGLEAAVRGIDAVLHCASSPRKQTWETDVGGTGRLLAACAAAATGHFFFVSIAGVDRIPLGYYKAKLAAERAVEQSGVPSSILRATQFHSLIDTFLHMFVRLPVALLPTAWKFQPIDTGEVADRIVADLARGPGGRLPDTGGPQVRTWGDLARSWLRARRKRALILPLPLPGKTAAGFRHGYNCTPEHADGKITWEQWLERRYGAGD